MHPPKVAAVIGYLILATLLFGSRIDGIAQKKDKDYKLGSQPAPEMMEIEILNKSLKFFGVRMHKRKLEVNWVVALEKRDGKFTIQRSEDNLNWETVDVKDGIGTNLPIYQSYQYIDKLTYPGTYFYRLRKYYKDQSFYESEIVTIVVNEKDVARNRSAMEDDDEGEDIDIDIDIENDEDTIELDEDGNPIASKKKKKKKQKKSDTEDIEIEDQDTDTNDATGAKDIEKDQSKKKAKGGQKKENEAADKSTTEKKTKAKSKTFKADSSQVAEEDDN